MLHRCPECGNTADAPTADPVTCVECGREMEIDEP